jgi:hypothetical protein
MRTTREEVIPARPETTKTVEVIVCDCCRKLASPQSDVRVICQCDLCSGCKRGMVIATWELTACSLCDALYRDKYRARMEASMAEQEALEEAYRTEATAARKAGKPAGGK